MQADVKLDTLGYFCPMPIILTSKKIKELTLGQVLEVVSDDEGIKTDMPAWCDTTGHQMVGMEEEQATSGRIYKALVKANPKEINYLSQLAQTQYQAGQKYAAIETLRLISADKPELKGQIDEAIKQIERQ